MDNIRPYFVVENSIYFTDRVDEVEISTFDQNELAVKISSLLNDAYNTAYQDGLNASLNKQYKELIDKILSLTIENTRYKKMLNLNEDK